MTVVCCLYYPTWQCYVACITHMAVLCCLHYPHGSHMLPILPIWQSYVACITHLAVICCLYYPPGSDMLPVLPYMVLTVPEEWQHYLFVGELLVGGYLLHYVPYMSADRTLFLHHYLPAVTFKILVLAALLDHLVVQHWR